MQTTKDREGKIPLKTGCSYQYECSELEVDECGDDRPVYADGPVFLTKVRADGDLHRVKRVDDGEEFLASADELTPITDAAWDNPEEVHERQ